MTKGLITVVVPSRIHEKNESLKSIKAQTYKNIEIVEQIDKDCKGASWARNKGYEKRKHKNNEFVFFCDNDIELEKDCLMNLYKTLQKNKKADWAFGRFKIGEAELNKG